MNLREKKVLTTAERNQLVNEYGPLQIVTVAATEEMPKITKLIDKEGLCTSHFMAQDLFEWQFGNEITELPADEYVPTGPAYAITYQVPEGSEAPASKKFRLTQGYYTVTKEDLPKLEIEGFWADWTLDGKVITAGIKLTGNVTFVAVKSDRPSWDGVARIGDILYSDKTTSATYDSSKTPIGICVDPGSKSANKPAKWVSVVNMSLTDPENGTTATGNDSSTNPGAGIIWGATGVINEVLAAAHPLVSDPSVVTEENPYGLVLELDTSKETNTQLFDYDNGTNDNWYPFVEGVYFSGDGMSAAQGIPPYPFNEDGSLNELFLANNGEIDGSVLTAAIIEAATATETEGEITNSSEEGHYPAPMACHRFTAGVEEFAGQWYMPSRGELSELMASLTKVNTQLAAMGENAVGIGVGTKTGSEDTTEQLGSGLWSSSEYSESSAWYLYTSNGSVTYNGRNSGGPFLRVRAFLKFTPAN